VIWQIVFANSAFIDSIFPTDPMNLERCPICRGVALLTSGIALSVNRFDPPN
jgi:hypothetical protein